MSGARQPGYEFIEQYELGLPSCTVSLATCVRDYADFLRAKAEQTEPPFDVDAICRAFDLQLLDGTALSGSGPDGASLDALGLIVVVEGDHEARRRFTIAHELIEILVRALQGNQLGPVLADYVGDTGKKEALCHWGASYVLAPDVHVRPLWRDGGASLALADELSRRFGLSLVAAAHTVCDRDRSRRTALVVWRLAHTAAEERTPGDVGQTALFGVGHRPMPPQKVRVWWARFPKHLSHLQVTVGNSSTPNGSHVHTTYHGGAPGTARERVQIGRFDGVCAVDARRVRLGDEVAVVSLLGLPPKYGPTAPAPTLA